jgi:hypothetical protein
MFNNYRKYLGNCKLNYSLFLILFFFIFLISFISAESIGTFKQNSEIELFQTCNNCTYCNLTSIKYPNSTSFLSNLEMSRDGTYYNYYLSSNYTNIVGDYKYCYDCGNSYESLTGCIDFEITQTGVSNDRTFNLVFIGIAILIGLFFLIFSFSYDNFFMIFSAMGFLSAGIMILYLPMGIEEGFIKQALSLLLNGIGLVILGVYVIKDRLPK